MFVLSHVNFRKSVLNHVNFKSVFFKKAYGTSTELSIPFFIHNLLGSAKNKQNKLYFCFQEFFHGMKGNV